MTEMEYNVRNSWFNAQSRFKEAYCVNWDNSLNRYFAVIYIAAPFSEWVK